MTPYPGVREVLVWKWECPVCGHTQQLLADMAQQLIEDREPWMVCAPCVRALGKRSYRGNRGGG